MLSKISKGYNFVIKRLGLLVILILSISFSFTARASCSGVFSDLNSELKDTKSWTIILGSFHNQKVGETTFQQSDKIRFQKSEEAFFLLQDKMRLSSEDKNILRQNVTVLQNYLLASNQSIEKLYVLHTATDSILPSPKESSSETTKNYFQLLKEKYFANKSSSNEKILFESGSKKVNEIGDEKAIQRLGQLSHEINPVEINITLPKGHSSSISSLVRLLSWVQPKSSQQTKVKLRLSVDVQEGDSLFGELSTMVLIFGNELKQLYPNLKIELFDAKTGLALKSDFESIENVKGRLLKAMIKAKLKDRSGNHQEVEKYFEGYIRNLLDNFVADFAESRREVRAVEIALSHESLEKLHTASPLDKILAQALTDDAQFIPESFEIISTRISANPMILSQEMERFREETIQFEKELVKNSGSIYRRLMVQIRQDIRNQIF